MTGEKSNRCRITALVKLLSLQLLLMLFSFNGYAQQSIRLIDGWEFLKQDVGGIWEAVRPVVKDAPESLPLWTTVTLPHCVNAEDAVDLDVNYYQGPAWYHTLLEIKNPYASGRTLLHFEGAGQKTEVYVYDKKVGEHVGGYDEFTVDITDAVKAFTKTTVYTKQFKIPLSIRTDNSRDLQLIPSNLSDFTVYGGIYRYLNLVYTPALSVDKIFAKAEVDKDGKRGGLTVTTRLYNPLNVSAATITVNLIDPNGRTVTHFEKSFTNLAGDIPVADFIVKAPQLWSPVNPQLYTVQITINSNGQTCTQVEKVGFRFFEFESKGPFLLNGKRLLLQGTHRHEDAAGVGAAFTEEMMRQEMILIKEMGVNFIRLGHYQQSRIILNLCDSLGILVWEEIPWCRGGLGGDVYKRQAKRMLINMIEQHYNHPAIFIWGLGNENDWPGDFQVFDKEAIRNFMQELHTLSHTLDSSRKTAIRRCEFCKDIVDVYSPSIWAGWYRGIYTDYKSISKDEADKVTHFLHVEWGGDSHAGRYSEEQENWLQQVVSKSSAEESEKDSLWKGIAKISKNNDWSESYICNLIDWHLKEQETMPWLTGSAQWSFRDFATPIRLDNPIPYINQKGLVERDLTKKESYYVFQCYWAARPMVHIYGHTWPVRWGAEGEEKMMKVYSNCPEAELFVNGRSYGSKKRNSADFPATGLRWNIVPVKGRNEIRVIAKSGKTVVEDKISFEYQTQQWGKPAKLTLQKKSETNDTVTIEAQLSDVNNITCLDAANVIRFGLTGDGKLIDNQGTSSGSRVIQLHNGRAIIKVKRNGGASVASVQMKGVPTAFLELKQSFGKQVNMQED